MFNRLKVFSQTSDAWLDRLSKPQIHGDHMIVIMMDNSVQEGNHLRVSPTTQPALKDRELQPFAVPVHDLEDSAPAFCVGDIIGDDIEMFVHTDYLVLKAV